MNILEKVKTNNPTAFRIIKNAVDTNKVAHAYLFSAPKNTLIEDEPRLLAQSLINEDPFNNQNLQAIENYIGLQVIDGSEGLIKKEKVVNAALELSGTVQDKRGIKILIIKNVENGNKQSLNSLLKFIEEPTPNTFIIMTTNNVSQVISTIRSRAQVINLRSVPFEKMVSEIESKGIDPKYSRVLASVSKNSEDALDIFGKAFEDLYEGVVEAFSEANHVADKAITGLSTLIKKTNVKLSLPMIRTFVNDIWKAQQDLKLAYAQEADLIKSYASNNFDFQEALIIINDFIIAQDSYVNFELYKTQMLIRLRRCYG